MEVIRVVDVIAAILLVFHVARLVASGIRLRRIGTRPAIIAGSLTVDSIGLGIALLAAVAGGYAAFYMLRPYILAPLPMAVAQLMAGLLVSSLAARTFYKWLASPVREWFTAEEELGHGW